jgi:preprotein translocase subunit SecG
MAFIIVLLTLAMVLDSVILVLLVLIQLPKKEAGGVLAFGASGADALFGAGSGTMLTKITKYAATAFFILAIILSLLQSAYHNRHISAFEENLTKTRQQAPAALPPTTTPATPPPSSTPNVITATNEFPLIGTSAPPRLSPAAESTNLPAATTNVAPPQSSPK